MTRLTIRTPSRLHFGLLGWGPTTNRQFGGVGLMTEDPGLELVVERAPCWEGIGPLAGRSLEIASMVVRQLGEDGQHVGPLRIENARIPEAHVGLGVGTQLSLAVARAITEFAGLDDTPVETLARLTGRGRRSGIGIHGFAEGGLIVDAGRRGDSEIPTRLIREEFPPDWSILIILPEKQPGLHGEEEVRAFQVLPPVPERLTDHLCRLVLLGILPALIERDLDAFGAAIEEMQRIVGTTFAPVQGGLFARPETEALIRSMRDLGLHGAGQSSWGPALYAFSDQDDKERDHLRDRMIESCKIEPGHIFWTRASRTGATVQRE